MDPKLKKIHLPTAEEMEATAEASRPARVASWREHLLPYYIESWPQAVHALSVKSVWVPFPVEPWRTVWKAERESEQRQQELTEAYFQEIKPLMDELYHRLNTTVFFRLGSRSPKDWWYGHDLVGRDRGCTQPAAAVPRDIALSFLYSERVLEDSFDAEDAGYAMQLVGRSWLAGIEPHREFRCFMEDRKLVGISVYRAWEEEGQPLVIANPKRWETAIHDWFPQFAEVSHVESAVFDVVVLDNHVVLLELNPWLTSTYPAHFYGKPLDGRFRYIGDGDSEAVG